MTKLIEFYFRFQGSDDYSAAKTQLIAIMIIPHILVFFIAFSKALFGRVPFPSMTMMIGVGIIHDFYRFSFLGSL